MWKSGFILCFWASQLYAQSVSIHYPDSIKPGLTPVVFAKGLISSDEHEFGCCFSPDGREFYFTRAVGSNKKKSILVSKFDGERWGHPQKALPAFEGETYEPHIPFQGDKLYFMGMLVKEIHGKRQFTMDLYYAEKEAGQWTKINHLGEPFNPSKSMFVSTTQEGFLFTTNRAGEGPDIVYVKPEGHGKFSHYFDVGPTVNTDHSELYPFVSSDGGYLLFNRYLGKNKELFVCFRQEDGSWGEAKRVPLGMASGCPMVSPDGKYLFFNSGVRFLNDIFWVRAEIFLSLKKE